MELKVVSSKYHSLSHPWLHKPVLIVGEHVWKGKQGEIVSYAPIRNIFGVVVPGAGQVELKREHIFLM